MEDEHPSAPPLTLTVLEAATTLRLSRAKVYRLIEQEGFPTVHFGRAVRIPVDLLHEWLQARIQKEMPTDPIMDDHSKEKHVNTKKRG